jgi:hypothetical protein
LNWKNNMKICEILSKKEDADVLESASSGSTGSGSIATVASGLGGPMADVIRRMPAGQSFFGGGVPQEPQEPQKKKKKKAKQQ